MFLVLFSDSEDNREGSTQFTQIRFLTVQSSVAVCEVPVEIGFLPVKTSSIFWDLFVRLRVSPGHCHKR